jgi:1,2-dihydroxy-3-keto-5-methylthiopentene dioxygenase
MGIVHYIFPPSDPSSIEALENIAETRNYANHDEIMISPSAMGAAYTEKINAFYEEHMHEDEEIRYILQGAGYFDVRDMDDRWVRMRAEEGDLVILPAGIYHRFTVDEGDVGTTTQVLRLPSCVISLAAH